MQLVKCIFLMAVFLICCRFGKSQPIDTTIVNNINQVIKSVKFSKTDSGLMISQVSKRSCKNFSVTAGYITAFEKSVSVPEKRGSARGPKFISVDGSISYDFFYRSRIDTPIAQRDFKQHTERVNLNVMLNEKYPLRISFSLRQSNSQYFRNFNDVNLQFDRSSFQNNVGQAVLNTILKKIDVTEQLKKIQDQIEEKKRNLTNTMNWMKNPSTLQKIIEEKELVYNRITKKAPVDSIVLSQDDGNSLGDLFQRKKQFNNVGSTSIVSSKSEGSVKENFSKIFDDKKKLSDSIRRDVDSLEKRLDSIRNASQKKIFLIKQRIQKAKNQSELSGIAKEYGVNNSSITKFDKRLSGLKNFSIGRSVLNYTELTAQNITLSGVNLVYNSSYYAAFAAGKIDYRFRDFLKPNYNEHRNSQYLVMGRFGLGDKDKTALIFSLFQGRKNPTQFAIGDSSGRSDINILGYSLEAIYKTSEYTSFSAEFAKSTMPVTGGLMENKQVSKLWNFSDGKNTGINFKAQTLIPETHTKLSGFYRRTGSAFQSFSLFSYNTNQTAWVVKAEQALLKNKITLTGMLRQNDFTNPFTDKTFQTTTVFKSLMLNIRIPKYPSVSVGYYPSSQFYFVDKDKLSENAYYILNASAVHSYFFKGIGMTTTVLYNQFFNKATDSGFILYKGKNYYASQTLFLNKLQLVAGYAFTKQVELNYYTLESSLDYSFSSILKLGAGIKYNKVLDGTNYWGQRFLLDIDLRNWGGLQFQYEKAFLQTLHNSLVPVEIGRVSLFKIF